MKKKFRLNQSPSKHNNQSETGADDSEQDFEEKIAELERDLETIQTNASESEPVVEQKNESLLDFLKGLDFSESKMRKNEISREEFDKVLERGKDLLKENSGTPDEIKEFMLILQVVAFFKTKENNLSPNFEERLELLNLGRFYKKVPYRKAYSFTPQEIIDTYFKPVNSEDQQPTNEPSESPTNQWEESPNQQSFDQIQEGQDETDLDQEKYTEVNGTILPPDHRKIQPGSGEEGFEKREILFPRTKTLHALLKEMNEKYEPFRFTDPDNAKQKTRTTRISDYKIFYLLNKHKAIYVNDQEGNATFILTDIDRDQLMEYIDAGMTKKSFSDASSYVKINFTSPNDLDKWKNRIREAILRSNKEQPTQQELENIPQAGEGSMTMSRMAEEFKVSRSKIRRVIKEVKKEIGIDTMEDASDKERYMVTRIDGNGHERTFYTKLFIEKAKKELEKMPQQAEEGLMTMYRMEKEFKVNQRKIKEVINEVEKEIGIDTMEDASEKERYMVTRIDGNGNERTFYTKLFVDRVKEKILKRKKELEKIPQAEEGSMTLSELAKALGLLKAYHQVEQFIEEILEDTKREESEVLIYCRGRKKGEWLTDRYTKEFCDEVIKVVKNTPIAEEGSMTFNQLIKKLKTNLKTLSTIINNLIEERKKRGNKERVRRMRKREDGEFGKYYTKEFCDEIINAWHAKKDSNHNITASNDTFKP